MPDQGTSASSNEEEKASKGGYNLRFYPGFLSSCKVKNSSGEITLYQQSDTYHLPGGQQKPKSNYRIHFEGGDKKQDVTLNVHDPALRIKSIVVELYGDDHVAGSGKDTATADTLSLMNNGSTCPPDCPTAASGADSPS